MRKWQDLAAPDDPNSWADVNGMWPTMRETYETADISAPEALKIGAGVVQVVRYAFAYGVSGGAEQEYVAGEAAGSPAIYSWNGSSFTSRFSGGSAYPVMARFGAATLAAGIGTAPNYALHAAADFTSNFSSVAGSPAYTLLAVQSNAVLMFNAGDTAAVGSWAVSDVGGYTTWSGGESASGTVYAPQGGFTSAIAYGNDVYAFKQNSIHRFTYVGGTVKWQVQTAWVGNGVPYSTSGNGKPYADWAIATRHGIVFYGGNGAVFLFDGSSSPKRLNPLTTIPVETIMGVFTYDPSNDMVCIAPSRGSSATGLNVSGASSLYYYYSFPFDAWGNGVGNAGELPTNAQSTSSGVLRGDWLNRLDTTSPKPVHWVFKDPLTDDAVRNAPTAGTTGYLQSTKYGRSDGKTTFSRLIPLLRRRTDLGSDSAALSFETFIEREDTSAAATSAITESTYRKQFDLGPTSHNYGRFKVTWTNIDAEVDDFLLKSQFVPDSI